MSDWDGRPPNPERDGWHWLGDDRNPQPVLWLAEFASWTDGTMHSPQSVVGLGFCYIGPCLLPSEVAAQIEAARREGIAAAATELRAIAARMRRMDLVDLQVLANAATLEQAADALAELPAARKLTGLEYRGG
jgi:hypothetical protein